MTSAQRALPSTSCERIGLSNERGCEHESATSTAFSVHSHVDDIGNSSIHHHRQKANIYIMVTLLLCAYHHSSFISHHFPIYYLLIIISSSIIIGNDRRQSLARCLMVHGSLSVDTARQGSKEGEEAFLSLPPRQERKKESGSIYWRDHLPTPRPVCDKRSNHGADLRARRHMEELGG